MAQGVITGIRGLCNGLGPALFGFIFYLFKVDFDGQGLMMPTKPAVVTMRPSNVTSPSTLTVL